MWKDPEGDSIYIQGGHFYDAALWNESIYFVSKRDIPPYNIWKFDLQSQKWSDVTKAGGDKSQFNRTFGGAALSVPSIKKSFYLGYCFCPDLLS
jgi:hypothetical protein